MSGWSPTLSGRMGGRPRARRQQVGSPPPQCAEVAHRFGGASGMAAVLRWDMRAKCDCMQLKHVFKDHPNTIKQV